MMRMKQRPDIVQRVDRRKFWDAAASETEHKPPFWVYGSETRSTNKLFVFDRVDQNHAKTCVAWFSPPSTASPPLRHSQQLIRPVGILLPQRRLRLAAIVDVVISPVFIGGFNQRLQVE